MAATLSISLADAETQLATVNAAMQAIISGTRLGSFKVGSGQFTREYTYQQITIDSLRQLQAELLTDIAWYNAQNGQLPNFSKNKTIPLLVRKDYFNVWQNGRIY